MKMEGIRQLPLEELKVKLRDTTEELTNLKFQLALHQLDNTSKVRLLRRDVARLKTVLHEIELGIRKANQPRL
jgi:large subunit ribosomal protein L29